MQLSVTVNNEYTPLQIFLSRFFLFFPPIPPSSVFWIPWTGVCKSGSVVFSRTCFVFQLPADSSLSNPPWSIYKLHVRAAWGISQALLSVGSLVQRRRHTVITQHPGEVGNVLLSVIINVNFFLTPPHPREQSGGLPFRGEEDEMKMIVFYCLLHGKRKGERRWWMNTQQLVWAARM